MEILNQAYDILFWGALIVLAVCLLACLIMTIRGPHTPDRIVGINMIGTVTIIMIAVFSVLLDQNYLADISMIYAMLSFISVIVLTKIYIGVYRERQAAEKAEQEQERDA
ncbi:MAG: sodium:proton antiporter [Ruminococcaceae bacterium]|nr:sodium:proton antiporter [Oscillospiraceae bacterium]